MSEPRGGWSRGVYGALTALALLSPLTPRTAEACAGCSNPNLPSVRSQESGSQAGALRVGLNLTGTTMQIVHSEHCPEIGPICDTRAEPPQLHDQTFWIAELRPVIDYSFTERFGLEVQLPFRYTHTSVIFRRLDGTAFTPDYENIHHRNETLTGLGDPWLSGRASLALGTVQLSARAGVTLPLGRTEENPFERAERGLSHQHVQFGTGTVNPLLGLDAHAPLGPFTLSAWAQTQVFLVDNRQGYRAGNRYAGGLGVRPELDWPVTLELTADLLNEQPERWDGVIQQEGNVGRTDALAGLTVRRAFGELDAALGVKVPVWQHFIEAAHAHEGDPGQVRYPAIVNLSQNRSF